MIKKFGSLAVEGKHERDTRRLHEKATEPVRIISVQGSAYGPHRILISDRKLPVA